MVIEAYAKQVGALPWRKRRGRTEILLVTSRETKRWIVPKGWPMPNRLASSVARQEAFEEAGVEGTVLRKPIGHYTYQKRTKDGFNTPCIVRIYALRVEYEHETWPEHSERERRWFEIRKAVKKVGEAELRDVILAFAAGHLRRSSRAR